MRVGAISVLEAFLESSPAGLDQEYQRVLRALVLQLRERVPDVQVGRRWTTSRL